jgi:hypothetical protein
MILGFQILEDGNVDQITPQGEDDLRLFFANEPYQSAMARQVPCRQTFELISNATFQ